MEPRPKLLFLVPALKDPPETGGELYNLKLAKGLQRDWDITVATFDDMPGFARTPTAYEGALTRYINDHGPYQVVVQDTYVYPFAASANRRLRNRVPLVGFGQAIYSERYRHPMHKWRHARDMASCMKSYEGLIVVSESMRRHAERLRFPKERVEVVSPGYDLADGGALPPITEPYRFIGAGSYQPAKGQLLAVQAMAELFRQRPYLRLKCRLDLYGNMGYSPKYVQEVKDAVASAHMEESVGIHGPVPQEDLWFEFGRSHGFVFPASGEGVGMVTVEAMAFGCVPILADDDLSQDLIGPDEPGILVPREPVAIAAAMTKLIDNRARWEDMRQRAQSRSELLVRRWDVVIDEFSAAIKKLAGDPQAPVPVLPSDEAGSMEETVDADEAADDGE